MSYSEANPCNNEISVTMKSCLLFTSYDLRGGALSAKIVIKKSLFDIMRIQSRAFIPSAWGAVRWGPL